MYGNNYILNLNYLALSNTFRKLWEEHVMWTRSFIISDAENLKDIDFVTKRLLRNPSDFADVLKRFYGNEKAMEFERLLREHLLIAADLVNAAKAGDSKAAAEARRKWYRNADEIAYFLSQLNPYWNENEWKKMLYDHLKMTENEAVQRLNKQYQNDIDTYDMIENQALIMADYMSEGIKEQFTL